MKKIGMLTSGGDCQGLNAALRGVGKTLYNHYGQEVQIYGIRDGYRGLIEGNYHLMSPQDFSGILTRGGTILGTSREPFKKIRMADENSVDKVASMKLNYNKLQLDCLVVLGGNGTHKTANLLRTEGLNIVSLPKTIDNDIWGTDVTFGFSSAVGIATQVVDAIHTTATSHQRIFIIEIMGHKVGWMTLYAGIGGGADIILIPEIPYDIDIIASVLEKRNTEGKMFSIIAAAEGAISKQEAAMPKKQLKSARAEMKHPSVAYLIADQLSQRINQEIRACVPGHFQRGGSPDAADKILTTRLGTAAAELIIKEQYGYMVGVRNNKMVPVALQEVAGRLKDVPPDSDIVREAKLFGISFGDE
ncbi:MAG TPA: 6-phosphofructokinase [Ruminococcaceae bacterium]|nr:6-phosphofructokinase [Oscillospiraceae bacterium]